MSVAWREQLGRPASVVVYPDARNDVWRYAIVDERGGLVDGRLTDVPAGAPDTVAKVALEQRVIDLVPHLRVEWLASARPRWWTGEVYERPAGRR